MAEHTTEWLKGLIERGNRKLARRLVTPARIDADDMAQMWAELSGRDRAWLVGAGAVGEVAPTVTVENAQDWRHGHAFDGAYLCTYEAVATVPGLAEPFRLIGWSMVAPIDANDGRGRRWQTVDDGGDQTGRPRARMSEYVGEAGFDGGRHAFPLWERDGRFVTFDAGGLRLELELLAPDHGSEPTWEDVEEPADRRGGSWRWIVRGGRVVKLDVWNHGLGYYYATDERDQFVGRWWAEAWGVRADEPAGVEAASFASEAALMDHLQGLSDTGEAHTDEYLAERDLVEGVCGPEADSGDELFAGVGLERNEGAGDGHGFILTRDMSWTDVTPEMATSAALFGWRGAVLESGMAEWGELPGGVYRTVRAARFLPAAGPPEHVTVQALAAGGPGVLLNASARRPEWSRAPIPLAADGRPNWSSVAVPLTDTARALVAALVAAPRGELTPALVLADALDDAGDPLGVEAAALVRAAVAAERAR